MRIKCNICHNYLLEFPNSHTGYLGQRTGRLGGVGHLISFSFFFGKIGILCALQEGARDDIVEASAALGHCGSLSGATGQLEVVSIHFTWGQFP